MEEYKDKGAYSTQPESSLTEYYDIILSFMDIYTSTKHSILVRNFIQYIEDFLKSTTYEDAPIMSTVHSMKGGEGDNIFIIDYPKFPYKFSKQSVDEEQQEQNLQYVAITRAKKTLNLVMLEPDNDELAMKNIECKQEVEFLLSK